MNTNHKSPQPDARLDHQLSAALERKPTVPIAPDFAARVAARAAALPAHTPRRRISYGLAATFSSGALLLIIMFALAPRTQPGFTSIAFDIEIFAAAQLIAIAWWLSMRRRA